MIEQDRVSAAVRRLRVIWLALMASVASTNVVVWLLLRTQSFPAAGDFSTTMLTALAVVVAGALMLAPLVRRRIETPPPGADAEEIVRRWQTGWIVGQAMKESVGLAGLVLALLAGSTAWAWGFAIASLGSMVLTPPWEHEVRLRLQRATGSPVLSPR